MSNNNNINSIQRAFKILQTVFEAEKPIGISTISKESDLPKATVFRIISTLIELGAVKKHDDERYSLGLMFIPFGEKTKEANPLKKLTEDLLKQLRDKTGETVNLGILEDEYVYSIVHLSGESYLLTSSLSPISPLYASSLGKIFLAHSPDQFIKNYFNKELIKRTPNTITTYDDFLKEKESILSSSISYDNEEFEYGLSCIATPVYNSKNELIAAINISGPTTRLNMKGPEILSKHLRETANQITSLLKELSL